MSSEIIIALLSLVGTLVGAYLANRKSAALVAYRLEQLEKKVNQHNQVVERTYALEESVALRGGDPRGADDLPHLREIRAGDGGKEGGRWEPHGARSSRTTPWRISTMCG